MYIYAAAAGMNVANNYVTKNRNGGKEREKS